MNPARVGIGLLEGMLEASRVALADVEDDLRSADWRPQSAPLIVAASVMQGYWTFFREMAQTDPLAEHPQRPEREPFSAESRNSLLAEATSQLERDARLVLLALDKEGENE